VAIGESLSRLAGSCITILRTRLELISVEVEEEALRFISSVIFVLAAMFCTGMAVLLGVVLILVIYWDTARLPVLIALMAFFALSGAAIAMGMRRHYRMKPRMLAHTLSELSRDIEQLTPDDHQERAL
jgi:uncharacterized membrane protein YqjE